jgi:hypothetical protein
MNRIRKYLESLPKERVVIDRSKDGHTSRIQKRVYLFFWKTQQVNETQKEFDDVLVSLGVAYFDYLGRNAKALGLSKQYLKARAAKFGKKVVRKSVNQ